MINRKTSSVSANELRGLLHFAEDKHEVWQMIYNDALTVLGMLRLNFQWNKISLPSEELYGWVSQPTAATFAAEVAIWLGGLLSASAFWNLYIIYSIHSL